MSIHFQRHYQPIADAIARLDIDQEVREEIADELTKVLASDGKTWQRFKPDLFRLLCADPLVPCVGSRYGYCPERREIRIGMHLDSGKAGTVQGPEVRSEAWRSRMPETRCVTCGAKEFIEGYAEAVAANP